MCIRDSYRGQEVVARMKYLGVNRRRFSTVITDIDYEFEKDFKVVGNKIELKNYNVFNAIIKRGDLETIKENKGVITII